MPLVMGSHANTSRLQQVAVTLGALAYAIALQQVRIPGLDLDGVKAQLGEYWSDNLSVAALGVSPIVSAFAIVELAAVLREPWRKYRHDPAGRRKLQRAVGVLGVLFAVFQAFGLVMYLEGLGWLEGGRALPWVTLVGGCCSLWLAAMLVDLRGLGNGVAVMLVGTTLAAYIQPRVLGSSAGPAFPYRPEPLSAWEVSAMVGAVLATVVVTFVVCKDARRQLELPQEQRSGQLPLPACGTAPFVLTAFVISQIPVPFHVDWWWGLDATLRMAAVSAAALLGAFLYSYLFNQPRRVAGCLLATKCATKHDALLKASTLFRNALPATIGFIVVLLFAERLGEIGSRVALPSMTVALAVALLMDIREQWQRPEAENWTPVWQEHRVYAVPMGIDLLRSKGIECRTEGFSQRALLQFSAAFVPVTFLVHNRSRRRAERLLNKALGAERIAPPQDESEQHAPQPEPSEAVKRARSRRTALVWGLAVATGLLLVPVGYEHYRASNPDPIPAAERRALVQLYPLADDLDPFGDAFDQGTLPEGASLLLDTAPVGPGRTNPIHAVQFMAKDPNQVDQIRARARAWLSTLEPPAGTRFAVTDLFPGEGNSSRAIGVRSYLLVDRVVFDGADIVDAYVTSNEQDVSVGVRLSGEAGERFRQFTAENLKRRLAIMVRGEVLSAPVIQSEIAGGLVQITMGAGTMAERSREAHELAQGLLGRK